MKDFLDTPDPRLPRSELEAARRDMAEAEALLRSAIKRLEAAPRADKITMSDSLRSAFAHLLQVRTALSDIEALLGEQGITRSKTEEE